MIEEPYRWVEAIQNRREYIEDQLAAARPVVALSCADGILLATVGAGKLFEIYDRIAMGGLGHPADIERLRMSAIEVAGAEGFNRSAGDVSLRRLTAYSLSPALKTAFEQIYGAPFLARLLFAELSQNGMPDVLLRLDYDGAFCLIDEPFAVISGRSNPQMEEVLRAQSGIREMNEAEALALAVRAWTKADEPSPGEVEAVLLDRRARGRVAFRSVKSS